MCKEKRKNIFFVGIIETEIEASGTRDVNTKE
jgi:hypothetical protein